MDGEVERGGRVQAGLQVYVAVFGFEQVIEARSRRVTEDTGRREGQ